MPDRWFAKSISQVKTFWGWDITLTTNAPSHLWLYYTFEEPWTHRTSAVHRGLLVPWDAYWCFVAWQKIEQDEAGDTLTHTFHITELLHCTHIWFRFHGTIDGVTSPSDSPIFHKHFDISSPAILRPNGDYDINIRLATGPDHYAQVNEFPVDTATFVRENRAGGYHDLYHLTPLSGLQTITKVATWMYAAGLPAEITFETAIRTHDTNYFGAPFTSASNQWFSTEYTLNPFTGLAWTLAEISLLKSGLRISAADNHSGRCRNVYVQVFGTL